MLMQDAKLAATASGIGAVEAMHAAVVRAQLFGVTLPDSRCCWLSCAAAVLLHLLYGMQAATDPATSATGLTLSTGTAVSYEAAVNAIANLRNVLGGTKTSSVENNLFRSVKTYTPTVNTVNQPNLYAVDANGIAFTRTPQSVSYCKYSTAFWRPMWHSVHQYGFWCCRYLILCTSPTLQYPVVFSPMVSLVGACNTCMRINLQSKSFTWCCVFAGNSAFASATATPAQKRCTT